MSATITLPRADALQIREALASGKKLFAALTALDAALAEPEQKPEPVAWMYVNSEGECEQIEYETPPAGDDSITPLYAAPPEPDAKPEPVHPGYVIGSHWLETAYSRIAAGEAEADVLRDIGLVREEAFLTGVAHLKAENEALRRDAERYRWLRDKAPPDIGDMASVRDSHDPSEIDAAIDAAMENKR